jgi:hypothetical protein
MRARRFGLGEQLESRKRVTAEQNPGSESHPIREAWAETFKMSRLSIAHDPFLEPSTEAFSCLASIDPAKKESSYATTASYHRTVITFRFSPAPAYERSTSARPTPSRLSQPTESSISKIASSRQLL